MRRARHFDFFFATRARRARHFEILFVTKKLSLTYTYPNVFPIFYCVQKKKTSEFQKLFTTCFLSGGPRTDGFFDNCRWAETMRAITTT